MNHAIVTLVFACIAVWALPASAESAIVHVVRPGETLASIADRYYGDPRRESVLVAENGLTTEGGSAIVVGLRLMIPTVSYHRVEEGETWAELAKTYYGDTARAFVLIEANAGSAREQPDTGAMLLVPYPLRHVVGQHETMTRLAKQYYENGKDLRTLRRFNNIKSNRLPRGIIVLVPLSDLVLSEGGRELAEESGAVVSRGGDVRAKQDHINDELEVLRGYVRDGAYMDGVAVANRLVGGGDLTGNQIVTIQRELGTALIALDRPDLALTAFEASLKQQPDLELDSARTSPKVLRVFRQAQQAMAQRLQAEEAAAEGAAAEPETEPESEVAVEEPVGSATDAIKTAKKKRWTKRKPKKSKKK